MFDRGSKICAIEASLKEGLAVVFEYENLMLEFSVTAKIMFPEKLFALSNIEFFQDKA